jgi:hypothetical protein
MRHGIAKTQELCGLFKAPRAAQNSMADNCILAHLTRHQLPKPLIHRLRATVVRHIRGKFSGADRAR